MKPYRREKIERIFRDDISRAIYRMKDPRLGFVTLTRVKLSEDLKHLKVGVSVLGDREMKKKSLQALRSATGFIRSYLKKHIHTRIIPELHIVLDERFEEAERVYQILRSIQKEKQDEQG